MSKAFSKLTSAAVATALIFTSSVTFAESPAPVAAPQAQNSWMGLSMLSPVGVGALGGAAAVAQPGPPQPVYDRLPPPPIPVLVVVLATLLTMIYIATRGHHHKITLPNSPF